MVYRHHSDPYIMYASSLFKGTYHVMGSVEQLLGGNATSITLLHYQLIDLWRSPRGTVLRIEALALVAIALSFFLAIFGSCRRWSNRWIIQKGFLAAQVLSISLGTYSIGLMQSSSVKSEMYPIWAVSLFALISCVDPVTSYNGLDYKEPILEDDISALPLLWICPADERLKHLRCCWFSRTICFSRCSWW